MKKLSIGLWLVVWVVGGAHGGTYIWKQNGAGPYNWEDTANWIPGTGYPALQDDIAVITNNISDGTQRQTIRINQNITVGGLRIREPWWNDYRYIETTNDSTLTFAMSSGWAWLTNSSFLRAPSDPEVWASAQDDAILTRVNFSTTTVITVDTPGPRDWGNATYPIGQRFGGVVSGITPLKTGHGMLRLTATNTFVGTLIVSNGWLWANINNDGVYGNPANTLVLGSRGHVGHLLGGPWLTRDVQLNGPGGGLHGLSFSNTISGPGMLLLGFGTGGNANSRSNNTYRGGTRVHGYAVSAAVTTNRVFGTGNLCVEYYGGLLLTNGPLSPTATVRVDAVRMPCSGIVLPAELQLATNYMPNIDPSASGILGFNGSSGPEINARLATNAPLLGDGYMIIGTRNGLGSASRFTGSSLQPNADGVYRFLNASVASRDVLVSTNGVEVFPDVPWIWGVGGGFTISAPQTFSGPLTVWPNCWCSTLAYQPSIGTNAWGDTNGVVYLRGGGLKLYDNGITNVEARRGVLSFEGMACLGPWSGGNTARMVFASMARTNNGMLAIGPGHANLFGTKEQVQVDAAPAVSNGMVAPYLVDYSGETFLTYVPGVGLTNAVFTSTNLATAGATDIVNLPTTNAVEIPAAAVTEVYALRAAGPLTTNASNPSARLKIGSGGLILAGGVTISFESSRWCNHTAPLDFGTNEGVVYVRLKATGTDNGSGQGLSGQLYGTNGLTVGATAFQGNPGQSFLMISANNSTTLYGQITINQAMVCMRNAGALGDSNNVICLNGWMGNDGNCPFGGLSTFGAYTLPNPIYLGGSGGSVGIYASDTTLDGKISGPGALFITRFYSGGARRCIINNAANDYAGGTYVYGARLYPGANARLGPGPIIVGGVFFGSGLLRLGGTNNVSVSNRLVIAHRTASQDGTDTERVQLAASPITVGSLEGNAPLENYYNGYTTFIMGGNDRSTHFFGNIYDYQYGKGLALVKMGAGTFTFWGEGLYRGTNRVESGAFLVNGYMLGQFVVTNAGVLGGVGLIDSNVTVQSGGVLNPGASVGRLVTRDVTFDAGGTFTAEINGPTPETDYDQLQVNGTVGLGSSTLNLVLGYTPAIGTSFTIIDNDGTSDAVVGTFNCAGKTQILAPMPMLFRVDYAGGDGNDVVVTRLPLQPGSLFIVR